MQTQGQQNNISDDEFLDLLQNAEFYKSLAKEKQQRLALIIFSGDDEMKGALFSLLQAASEDFVNIKNKFLSSEYQILNEIQKKLIEPQGIYEKSLRTAQEEKSRKADDKSADNLINNI